MGNYQPRYHPVSPNLWDKRFKSLKPESRQVYLYLLTCSHRRSEGLFRLPFEYMRFDTGMSAKEVTEALTELTAEGWIMLDERADMILDRRALEFFPPKGTKQIAGAVRVIANAPKTTLKIEMLKLAHINAPDLAEAITEECPELVNPALTHEGSHRYPIDTAR